MIGRAFVGDFRTPYYYYRVPFLRTSIHGNRFLIANLLLGFSGGVECITQHDDFRTLCLHETVLRNVLICLNYNRHDNWIVDKPSNKYESMNR